MGFWDAWFSHDHKLVTPTSTMTKVAILIRELGEYLPYVLALVLLGSVLSSCVVYKYLLKCCKMYTFKQKILQDNRNLKFYWDDIHIDEDIKNMLVDNVTNPLAIHQGSPTLSPNVSLPKGVLFSGPSGTGKTLLALIVAKESKCNFLSIDASDIKDSFYGESEQKVKCIFEVAKKHQPCIIFIDEIDTIMSERTSRSWDVENSIKGVFLTYWDGLYSKTDKSSVIVVIGATNRPKSLDSAFLRRLDLNIEIPLPNLYQKAKILKVLLKNSFLEEGFSFKKIALQATGFSGSDLAESVRYAIMTCSAEYHKKLKADMEKPRNCEDDAEKPWLFSKLCSVNQNVKNTNAEPPKMPITMENMESSIIHSKKSRSSGGGVGGLNSTEMIITNNLIHPNDIETTWDDIAGCDDIIKEIEKNLILPMKAHLTKC